jgi:hypothetical protein
MDATLNLWWTCFLIALVLDIVLWSLAFLLVVGPDARFRLLTAAAIVLYVILGMILGWGFAAAIGAVALWILAIIACGTRTSEDTRS